MVGAGPALGPGAKRPRRHGAGGAAHYSTMANKPNTPAKGNTAPATVPLPPANVVACPAKGRTTMLAGMVGGTYAVAVPAPAPAGTGAAGTPATVLLPFTLPAWAGAAGAPVAVVVASMAPNWLGRNGHPLRCAVYASPAGAVTVQPHAKGVQVNAYPAGLPGCGITVHSVPAATLPAANATGAV